MQNKLIQFFSFLLLFVLLQIINDKFIVTEFFTVFIFLIIFLSFNIRFDLEHIFAPVNLVLLIYFVRLYILPITAIFYGYSHWWVKSYDVDIVFYGHLITLASFLFFLIGWQISNLNTRKDSKKYKFFLNSMQIKIIIIFYLIFGITALWLYYKDFQSYLNSMFIVSFYDNEEQAEGNKFLSVLASFAKYFLPFTIYGFYSLINLNKKSTVLKIITYVITGIIMLLFTLNSNRQSMIYPLFAMIVAIVGSRKLKILPTFGVFLLAFYFIFQFQDIRSNKDYSLENNSENDGLKMIQNIQIYIGGSQMVTPIFKDPDEYHSTIIDSFLQSFPILGESFRENSGVDYYNGLFYGTRSANDQVYLTHAEAYKSGGILLLGIMFFFIGYFYQKINRYYYKIFYSQLLYRATFYYLFLLYNCLILLSFQVAGQYLYFNAMSGFIILLIYKKKYTKVVI